MTIKAYRAALNSMRDDLNKRKGQQQQLESEHAAIQSKVALEEARSLVLQQSQILLQKVSDTARQNGKGRLEEIVTSALQFVFGPDVSFEIELYEVSGRPQAEFYLITDNNGEKVKTKPMEGNGGGVVDIIALALRIAVLQIHHSPAINGPIILDEPGKHVSEEYAERMAEFLQQMSAYFNRQIIMVTHQPQLASVADKSFDVQMINGQTKVSVSA